MVRFACRMVLASSRASGAQNSAHYDEEIKSMLRQGQTRLVIDLNDVRRHDAQLGRRCCVGLFCRATQSTVVTLSARWYSLLRRPMEFIAPFQAGLRSYIRQMPLDDTIKIDVSVAGPQLLPNVSTSPPRCVQTQADYSIGVEGSFGAHRVTPRQLMARHLSTLVCVEGIVTKCEFVGEPKRLFLTDCPPTRQHCSAQGGSLGPLL